MKTANKNADYREFVDKDRPVMMEYYNLLEEELELKPLEKKLIQLIEKDPLFFDTYSLLTEVYEDMGQFDKAEEVLGVAYKKAIKRITNKEGVWPDSLEWGWLENRHIIRVILKQAMYLWAEGELELSLDLLRKLFASNIRDNIGARYYILAIRLNLDYEDYTDQFESSGYLDQKIFDWFDTESKKFPEDFDEFNKMHEEL